MNEDILSQEEIDALLNRSGDDGEDAQTLDAIEQDALGEVANISMGSAATALYSLLNHRVELTTPQVESTTFDELSEKYPIPCVVVEVFYTEGLEGSNLLVIKKEDAIIIADLMMGGDGTKPEEDLSDLHISAVGEAMNQMMGSAATSMSTVFERPISISPPKTDYMNFGEEDDFTFEEIDEGEELVKVSFQMIIGDLIDSELIQIIPVRFAKKMVGNLIDGAQEGSGQESPEQEQHTDAGEDGEEKAPVQPDDGATQAEGDSRAKGTRDAQVGPQDEGSEAKRQGVTDAPTGEMSKEPSGADQDQGEGTTHRVQKAEFSSFEGQGKSGEAIGNIQLIRDVPLKVTVELGQTKMLIREVLELAEGSIIELDKLAGEPVDILVNGKLIAQGEVVVIDENFGIRVTDIVAPMARISKI